ncbi:hypothetical protein [Burkholderia pseudomallei]|uniref:hypothetical protein n=1 Tax=Burkholderia pseudomallei TaxID=28450 RepID=UPI000A1A2181|nr:hypothetical protein [Burkholderia pseudomallei]ARK64455.1 hypothetical protein BOC37_33350 [Burkholderia pseudomallei]
MRHFVSGARELHGRASVHAHRASRIAHRASRIAHRASRIAHRASRIAHRASRIAHRASRIRRPDRHRASARNAPMPGRPSHAARSTPEQLPVDAVYMTPCSGM